MSTHDTDEIVGELDRMIRTGIAVGSQLAQMYAQRASNKQRAEAEQQYAEARRLGQQMELERDFARATFMPLATSPQRLDRAPVETVQQALVYASAWAEHDPQALTARTVLSESLHARWELQRELIDHAAEPARFAAMGPADVATAWENARQWAPFLDHARAQAEKIATIAKQRWGDVDGPQALVATERARLDALKVQPSLAVDALQDATARTTEELVDRTGADRLARAAEWARDAAPEAYRAWEADRTAGGSDMTATLMGLYVEAERELARQHAEERRAREELHRAEDLEHRQPEARSSAERDGLYGDEQDSRDEVRQARSDAQTHAMKAIRAETQAADAQAYDRAAESQLDAAGVGGEERMARTDSAPAFGKPTSQIPDTHKSRRSSTASRGGRPAGTYADRGRGQGRDLER